MKLKQDCDTFVHGRYIKSSPEDAIKLTDVLMMARNMGISSDALNMLSLSKLLDLFTFRTFEFISKSPFKAALLLWPITEKVKSRIHSMVVEAFVTHRNHRTLFAGAGKGGRTSLEARKNQTELKSNLSY